MSGKFTLAFAILFLLAIGCFRQSDSAKSGASIGFDVSAETRHEIAKESIGSLRSRVSALPAKYSDRRELHLACRTLVSIWAETHDPKSMSLEDVQWVAMQMLPEYTGDYPASSIEATWEGSLTAPNSGFYRFSLTPINLANTREEGEKEYFRIWQDTEIDGKVVVSSGPGKFVVVGEGVELQQGIPVSVKHTLRVQSAGFTYPLPAAGQLYWSGPDFDRQIIDSRFLTPGDSDEGANGIRLRVVRTGKYGKRSCSTIVDSVDQVIGKHEVVPYERTLTKYIERVAEDYVSDAYCQELLDNRVDAAEAHPLLAGPAYRGLMNKCSSETRRLVCEALANRPELVAPLDASSMTYFHDAVRFGAEEPALDLLATWLASQARNSPQLASSKQSYFESNLKSLRHLIIPLVLEHPESSLWLEEKHLSMPDGSCNVAASIVLRYKHLISYDLDTWIEQLDKRLEDAKLPGDQRASWLVARALAEEVRNCPSHYVVYVNCHDFGSGMPWLEQALAFAETPSTRDWLRHEIAARLVVTGQEGKANELLAEQGKPAEQPSIEPQAKRMGLPNFKPPTTTLAGELQRRLSHARRRGDVTAVEQYQKYIEKLVSH